MSQWLTAHLPNRFEIFDRVRQYHCRDLCKISGWFRVTTATDIINEPVINTTEQLHLLLRNSRLVENVMLLSQYCLCILKAPNAKVSWLDIFFKNRIKAALNPNNMISQWWLFHRKVLMAVDYHKNTRFANLVITPNGINYSTENFTKLHCTTNQSLITPQLMLFP